MIIALDIDGVLTNTQSKVIKLFNAKYHKNVKYEEYCTWGYLKETQGIPVEEEIALYREAWREPMDIPLMEEDIVNTVNALTEKYTTFFISARLGGLGETSRVSQYLDYHGFKINGLVYFVKSNSNGTDKADLKFMDVLVDDNAKTIEDAYRKGKISILRNQPWNESSFSNEYTKVWQDFNSGGGRFYRITSLKEINDIL